MDIEAIGPENVFSLSFRYINDRIKKKKRLYAKNTSQRFDFVSEFLRTITSIIRLTLRS